MNRRQFIGSAAAASPTAAASFVRAHDHAGHAHHTGHTGHVYSAPRAYEATHRAVAYYVETGQIRLAHCIALSSEGDTPMKDCAAGVNQVLVLCSTLQNLTAQNSRLTPSLAKVCIEVCEQCSAICKEHAGHHTGCKACYESCLACVKEYEKIAA